MTHKILRGAPFGAISGGFRSPESADFGGILGPKICPKFALLYRRRIVTGPIPLLRKTAFLPYNIAENRPKILGAPRSRNLGIFFQNRAPIWHPQIGGFSARSAQIRGFWGVWNPRWGQKSLDFDEIRGVLDQILTENSTKLRFVP